MGYIFSILNDPNLELQNLLLRKSSQWCHNSQDSNWRIYLSVKDRRPPTLLRGIFLFYMVNQKCGLLRISIRLLDRVQWYRLDSSCHLKHLNRAHEVLSHSFADLESVCFYHVPFNLYLIVFVQVSENMKPINNKNFWDSHFLQNILQLKSINSIEGLSRINEAHVDGFLNYLMALTIMYVAQSFLKPKHLLFLCRTLICIGWLFC